ncbi:Hypothetical protein NTJ_10806 [Nesidiocoris tenuis]|nr:Hypothetical protein NTJ_10806 [Nesidiocoris tenuis]
MSSAAGNRQLDLRGIFIPLTTPFNADEGIAFDKLKQNLKEYEKIPFTGYVVAGSNGEAPYLTPDERVQLVKFVRENTDGNKIVIGGSTAESTNLACELTSSMAKVGADGVLVMPPFYFRKRMTDEAIEKHYMTIADKCGMPIVIYNMPFVCGIDISTPLLAKMARHPLIRGVKDSDIRKCAGTVQDTKSLNFDVLIGSAGYLLGSLLNGCSGAINGLAGILGQELCDLYTAYHKGDFQKAREIQVRISKPDTLLLSELGVPGLKTAMDMFGLAGGRCRSPILPTTEADKQRIKDTLGKEGYL